MTTLLVKRDPVRIVSGLAMPAAGAYTGLLPVSPFINVMHARSGRITVSYVPGTPGAAGDGLQYIVHVNYFNDAANGPFVPVCLEDPAITVVAAPIPGFATTHNNHIVRTPIGQSGFFTQQFNLASAKWLQVQFAQYNLLVPLGTLVFAEIELDEAF